MIQKIAKKKVETLKKKKDLKKINNKMHKNSRMLRSKENKVKTNERND